MPSAALPLFQSAQPRLRWVEAVSADPRLVDALCQDLGLPAPLCRLLAQRGHQSPASAKAFLKPARGHLHPPAMLAGIGHAAERVARAIRGGELILVHGDYDVDGVCGTAVLTRSIEMMGGRAVPFVPHRIEHGYDLGRAGLAAAHSAGASLIVTADCGIVAHAAVLEARASGIDVIVTDHHTPGDSLPEALAVVNPNRPDCGYPEKTLAGAGVAYKLALAVADILAFPEERLAPLIDLVAVATIADLAPLTAENRAIVRWGLAVLGRTPNPGLRALLASSGLSGRDDITAGQVGFVLAPRINAVGRVGDPMAAVRLLLTNDPGEAERLAQLHELENQRRRELDEETLADALQILEESYEPSRDFGVVLASQRWHPGVIGIVASRIVERIHRPVMLIALGANEGKGSGRSIRGFHLQQALVACSAHLLRFGGHGAAAGCSIDPERVDAFREAFNLHARRSLTPHDLLPELRIDGGLELHEANSDLLRVLRHFGPFGIGNPTPVFAAYSVVADAARTVGRGHLKVTLRGDDSRLEAIGFDMGDRLTELQSSPRFDFAFRLEENEWTGRDGKPRRTVQGRIIDFRPAA